MIYKPISIISGEENPDFFSLGAHSTHDINALVLTHKAKYKYKAPDDVSLKVAEIRNYSYASQAVRETSGNDIDMICYDYDKQSLGKIVEDSSYWIAFNLNLYNMVLSFPCRKVSEVINILSLVMTLISQRDNEGILAKRFCDMIGPIRVFDGLSYKTYLLTQDTRELLEQGADTNEIFASLVEHLGYKE